MINLYTVQLIRFQNVFKLCSKKKTKGEKIYINLTTPLLTPPYLGASAICPEPKKDNKTMKEDESALLVFLFISLWVWSMLLPKSWWKFFSSLILCMLVHAWFKLIQHILSPPIFGFDIWKFNVSSQPCYVCPYSTGPQDQLNHRKVLINFVM